MSVDDKKAARTTIVGGQPPGNERPLASVPVGIEELLAMAAADERFAEALAERRAEAIAASGVQLSATEQRMIEVIDDASLRRMVTNIDGALAEPDRRAFLGRSMAALLALGTGGASLVAAAGCKDKEQEAVPVTGSRPDRPPPPVKPDASPSAAGSDARPPSVRPDASLKPTGVRPDRPRPTRPDQPLAGLRAPDRPADDPAPATPAAKKPPPGLGIEKTRPTKGIRPDRPRPDRPRPTRGIRPDRYRPDLVDPFGEDKKK